MKPWQIVALTVLLLMVLSHGMNRASTPVPTPPGTHQVGISDLFQFCGAERHAETGC